LKAFKATKVLEGVHVAGLIGLGIVALNSSLSGAAIFTVANIVANLYPIMLQRYLRLRIVPLKEAEDRRAIRKVPKPEQETSASL